MQLHLKDMSACVRMCLFVCVFMMKHTLKVLRNEVLCSEGPFLSLHRHQEHWVSVCQGLNDCSVCVCVCGAHLPQLGGSVCLCSRWHRVWPEFPTTPPVRRSQHVTSTQLYLKGVFTWPVECPSRCRL